MSKSLANGPPEIRSFATDRALVVLVVEDESLLRRNVSTCLCDAGYAVIETTSGEAAIAVCAPDAPIDIVFTDINLAGAATGWDVADHFHLDRSDVPVLYTSGKPIDAERCVPGSLFVSKPCPCAEVVTMCRRLRSG